VVRASALYSINLGSILSGVARVPYALGQETFLRPSSTKTTEIELKNRCKRAEEAKQTEFDSQLGHTKDFKNDVCCFSCLNAQHFRDAQSIKKQSVD